MEARLFCPEVFPSVVFYSVDFFLPASCVTFGSSGELCAVGVCVFFLSFEALS